MAKILIIEDSKELCEIYKSFLNEHEIVFALEQPEIEPLIEQVDLVICDYHFNPVLSYETVREIVGNRKPLILCSGEPNQVEKYQGVHKIDVSKRLKPLINDLLKSG